MTKDEILALIDGDAEAKRLATKGADNACAARLSELTEQTVTTDDVSEALVESRFADGMLIENTERGQ